MEKKEFDRELELARKGTEALRAAFDVNEKLEKRIEELEKRIVELDERFRRHVNNTDVHVSIQ